MSEDGATYQIHSTTGGTAPIMFPNVSNVMWTGTTQNTFDWGFKPPEYELRVKGDAEFEGDLKVKGKSIVDTLEKIEERLAILHRNEALEEKWEELRNLAKKYKALERDIIEKEKIWDLLNK